MKSFTNTGRDVLSVSEPRPTKWLPLTALSMCPTAESFEAVTKVTPFLDEALCYKKSLGVGTGSLASHVGGACSPHGLRHGPWL
jgi:hypothetical protein